MRITLRQVAMQMTLRIRLGDGKDAPVRESGTWECVELATARNYCAPVHFVTGLQRCFDLPATAVENLSLGCLHFSDNVAHKAGAQESKESASTNGGRNNNTPPAEVVAKQKWSANRNSRQTK